MNNSHLSKRRINWIREQGYFNYSDEQIENFSMGNRFAFRLCTAILLIGVFTANIPILIAMMAVAFFGVVLPNHPFDYIYNWFIADRIGRDKLPKRAIQLKFACTMATSFIAATIYLFANSYMLAGYLMGGHLVIVAGIVSLTDMCLPSKAFNWLFKIPVHTN